MSKSLHPKYQGAEWTVYDVANNSISKQKFSFPKSYRFNTGGSKGPLNDRVAYDLPSTLQQRATSFGFGERSQADPSKRCIYS